MKTSILKLSFSGHILIFLLTFINTLKIKKISTSKLLLIIYITYISDMISCYQGIIPFYRCKQTKDIYIHHLGALSILTMSLPSIFNIYPKNIYNIVNNIISNAFISSLNEAIMILGVSYHLPIYVKKFELLFKMYIFSINALLNSKNIYYLSSLLGYKYKDVPLYFLCLGSFSMYYSLYPSLFRKSLYKYKQLLI